MAAPKGNKFALGNTWGRPPKYEHPEDLANKILEFIEYSEEQGDSLTITGLCLYLGFESRSSFDKQAERDDDFSYIVKRAKMVIEQRYEEGLNSPACTGSIFALKNMGWKDKTEVDMNADITTNVDYSKLSDAALAEITALKSRSGTGGAL